MAEPAPPGEGVVGQRGPWSTDRSKIKRGEDQQRGELEREKLSDRAKRIRPSLAFDIDRAVQRRIDRA